MIEFCGYLSGEAEKYYKKSSRILSQKILSISMSLISPMVLLFSIKYQFWWAVGVYALSFITLILLTYIPQSAKHQISVIPKKIYTEEEYIVCVADTYTESRLISDVKQVIDYGTFYQITFPFGKLSDKFICQKDLISRGSIEEFEQLFQNALIRKAPKSTGDGLREP